MGRLLGVAVLLLVAGCGAGSPDTVSVRTQSSAPSVAASPVPTKCCVPPPEPSLRLRVEPSAGPPGTAVRLRITGCGVVDPNNAATVSFNNDSENVAARNDPKTVVNLGVHRGTGITLTYTIARSDRTGGVGRFSVQCGQTVLDTPFKVT